MKSKCYTKLDCVKLVVHETGGAWKTKINQWNWNHHQKTENGRHQHSVLLSLWDRSESDGDGRRSVSVHASQSHHLIPPDIPRVVCIHYGFPCSWYSFALRCSSIHFGHFAAVISPHRTISTSRLLLLSWCNSEDTTLKLFSTLRGIFLRCYH